jgi:hypothetical protein
LYIVVQEFLINTSTINDLASSLKFKTYTQNDASKGSCTFTWNVEGSDNAPSRSYKSDCYDGGAVTFDNFKAHDSIDIIKSETPYFTIKPTYG